MQLRGFGQGSRGLGFNREEDVCKEIPAAGQADKAVFCDMFMPRYHPHVSGERQGAAVVCEPFFFSVSCHLIAVDVTFCGKMASSQ